MIKHRFDKGAYVVLTLDDRTRGVRPGVYKILRQLPFTANAAQYVARRQEDTFDVVLNDELLLSAGR